MNIKQITNEISKNGFYYIPSYISNKKVEVINKQIKSNLTKFKTSTKGKASGTEFFNGNRILLNHLLNLRINTFSLSLLLINSKINKNFKKIAKNLLSDSYLRRIDSYISPVDKKPIIDWHNDTSYSGAEKPLKKLHHPNFYKLRFFLYLSDVKHKNGSLALIPGSHKIVSALTEIFYKNILQYEPYWNLDSFKKVISKNNFKNEIIKIVGEQNYVDFFKKIEFIQNASDTNEYDIESKAGGLVIFDDRVFHRGSSCLETDRTVMRFIYASKQFN